MPWSHPGNLYAFAQAAEADHADWVLKQQKSIFSQIYRLQVQDPGAAGFGSFWSLSPWLLPVYPDGLPHVLTSPSHKDTSHVVRTRLNDPIYLNYLFKDPFCQHSHILRSWVLALQLMNFKGTQYSLKHQAMATPLLWGPAWTLWFLKAPQWFPGHSPGQAALL